MERLESHPIKQDVSALSADPALPAFLAPPEGAPVYCGFPLIEETRTDGWCFGTITEFEDPDGCTSGDGYVEAPNGSRAGIVWSTDVHDTLELLPPDEDRWGVYELTFPQPVKTVEDLAYCFRYVLPELQTRYEKAVEKEKPAVTAILLPPPPQAGE